MMNLKSLKTATSFAINNIFHKGAKVELMYLMGDLKAIHDSNEKPVFVKNYKYFVFTKDGNEITVFIRHEDENAKYASGFTFGIDLVNSLFDFTKELDPKVQKDLHYAAKILRGRRFKLCDDPMAMSEKWFESCIG